MVSLTKFVLGSMTPITLLSLIGLVAQADVAPAEPAPQCPFHEGVRVGLVATLEQKIYSGLIVDHTGTCDVFTVAWDKIDGQAIDPGTHRANYATIDLKVDPDKSWVGKKVFKTETLGGATFYIHVGTVVEQLQESVRVQWQYLNDALWVGGPVLIKTGVDSPLQQATDVRIGGRVTYLPTGNRDQEHIDGDVIFAEGNAVVIRWDHHCLDQDPGNLISLPFLEFIPDHDKTPGIWEFKSVDRANLIGKTAWYYRNGVIFKGTVKSVTDWTPLVEWTSKNGGPPTGALPGMIDSVDELSFDQSEAHVGMGIIVKKSTDQGNDFYDGIVTASYNNYYAIDWKTKNGDSYVYNEPSVIDSSEKGTSIKFYQPIKAK